VRLLLTAAATVPALTACSQPAKSPTQIADAPSPVTATNGSGAARSAGPGDGSPLAGIDPCALLPEDAATRLGLSGRSAKTIGEARVCRWRYEGATLRDSFTVGVEIFERRGLDDLISTDARTTTVGGRPAKTFTDSGYGTCGVSLAVGAAAIEQFLP
jgi:hypothetical protein